MRRRVGTLGADTRSDQCQTNAGLAVARRAGEAEPIQAGTVAPAVPAARRAPAAQNAPDRRRDRRVGRRDRSQRAPHRDVMAHPARQARRRSARARRAATRVRANLRRARVGRARVVLRRVARPLARGPVAREPEHLALVHLVPRRLGVLLLGQAHRVPLRPGGRRTSVRVGPTRTKVGSGRTASRRTRQGVVLASRARRRRTRDRRLDDRRCGPWGSVRRRDRAIRRVGARPPRRPRSSVGDDAPGRATWKWRFVVSADGTATSSCAS